ncbi:hypothetical protein DdX_10648 [Ditylenchus destructor]|uniref:Uncharacterized protein n=1 Tax=Ditylenchus destructor TaxID=166010 RepID=A0AAD4N2F8_9BILA|nr:hypothetical protein DdX_10648 [Ditylenchus destructor]
MVSMVGIKIVLVIAFMIFSLVPENVETSGGGSRSADTSMTFKVFLKNNSDIEIDQPKFEYLKGVKKNATVRQLAIELEGMVRGLDGNDKLPFWKANGSNANGYPGGINILDPVHADEFLTSHFPGEHGMNVVIQRFEDSTSIVGMYKNIGKTGITFSGL